jgi:hypothetical protein
MANHAKKAPTPPDDSHQTKADGLLIATARTIGSAAGVVVSLTGMHETPAQAKVDRSTINGKFPKNSKIRMPRRLKKTARKPSAKGQPVSA